MCSTEAVLKLLQINKAMFDGNHEVLRRCMVDASFHINALVPFKIPDSKIPSSYQTTPLLLAIITAPSKHTNTMSYVKYLLAEKADPLSPDSNGAVKAHFDVIIKY